MEQKYSYIKVANKIVCRYPYSKTVMMLQLLVMFIVLKIKNGLLIQSLWDLNYLEIILIQLKKKLMHLLMKDINKQ